MCVHLGDVDQASVTVSGESTYTCDACVTSLGTSNAKDLASPVGSESLPPEGDKIRPASNMEYSISTVSSQLEAVRLNGQSTIHLIESLVGMVSKLTEEVANLKNDNVSLKDEIKSLHRLIQTAPGTYTASEQRVLPAVMSSKDMVTSQRVPLSAPSSETQPPIVPAATTLAGLSYRDVLAAGSSPPDAEGFTIVRSKRVTPTAVNTAAVATSSRKPRVAMIGAGSSSSLSVVQKRRTKSLFVSRFSPDVTASDVENSLKDQLQIPSLTCTRLKTKHSSYASFHVSVPEDDFSLINNAGVWPNGCLIAPYYGRLSPDQIFKFEEPATARPPSPGAGKLHPPAPPSVDPVSDSRVGVSASTVRALVEGTYTPA